MRKCIGERLKSWASESTIVSRSTRERTHICVFLAFYRKVNQRISLPVSIRFHVFISVIFTIMKKRATVRRVGDVLEILRNITSFFTRRSGCPVNHPKSRGYFSKRAQGTRPSRKTSRSNASFPEEFRKNGNDKRATLDDFLTQQIWKMRTQEFLVRRIIFYEYFI